MRHSKLLKTIICAGTSVMALLVLSASVAESHDAATARGSVNTARRSPQSALLLLLRAQKKTKTAATGKTPAAAYTGPAYGSLTALLQTFDPTPVQAMIPTVSAPVAKAVTLAAAAPAPAPMAPARTLLAVVDQESIQPRQRELADEVLRLLPAGCRDNLTNFYVRYDHPAQRGLGGKNTIIIDGSVPDSEFIGLLTHECWHVITASLDGTPGTAPSAFRDGSQVFYADSATAAFFSISWQAQNVRREGSSDADFASTYGKTDPFEDLAEFGIAYSVHPAWLEQRAQTNSVIRAKLEWMRRQYPEGLAPATSTYAWDKKGSVLP